METKKIVLATHNQGKIREFQKAFAEIGWQAVPIADIAEVADPEETGTTFEENALQKARCYAKAVDLPVLSDDSGIIACALGDRPGVYSARYAGHHGDDEANNQQLIRDLAPYTGMIARVTMPASSHLSGRMADSLREKGRVMGSSVISIRGKAASAMIRSSICRNLEKPWQSFRWKRRTGSAIEEELSGTYCRK